MIFSYRNKSLTIIATSDKQARPTTHLCTTSHGFDKWNPTKPFHIWLSVECNYLSMSYVQRRLVTPPLKLVHGWLISLVSRRSNYLPMPWRKLQPLVVYFPWQRRRIINYLIYIILYYIIARASSHRQIRTRDTQLLGHPDRETNRNEIDNRHRLRTFRVHVYPAFALFIASHLRCA